PEKCIGCELCYTACWDGAHQCIHLDRQSTVNGHRTPAQMEEESRRRISVTPIPKLDGTSANNAGPYATPIERNPRVDVNEWVGGNLCARVCPVDDCITMERVDDGKSPETWEQRAAALQKEGC